jgi:CTP synthase
MRIQRKRIPNCKNNIIDLMPDQENIDEMGGTLRLGLYPCELKEGTLAKKLYNNADMVQERHRHRYEFNNAYRESLAEKGMVFSGVSPDQRLVEIVELKNHPFYIAAQFHPEFISRPDRPQPIFDGFIAAALVKIL